MRFRLNGLLNKLRVSKPTKDFHDGHSYEKKKPVISEKQIPVPFPFVVLRNKAIVATSPRFENTFKCGQIDKISSIFPSFDPDIPKQNVKIGGIQYTAFNSQLISDDIQNTDILTIVYFVENEIANPENYQSEKTVVALIFIDNYEEVLSSIEDVRRPLLLALIDKRLNTLAQQVSGILRKFEKDRYLFIFSYDKLNYLKKKKFDILSQIREIDMGNMFPVTLSIGIGLNGSSLKQTMEYARAAVDLALGRGGDQALIKDADKYYFFGGVAKEVGNNTRVRARVKAYAFSELIGESDRVIVMGHRNIDLDCLGAAVGVCKIAQALGLGHDCHIILDEINANVKILYDRLMLEKEYSERIFLTSGEAIGKISKKTLIVIVDTHRPSMVACTDLLKHENAKKIVVFDHHRKAAEFVGNPVLMYHEPYASSTCELITEMLQYVRERIKFKPSEADALLAGITVDTKNFAIKTGAKTFEAAAYLRRNGADGVRVRLLFQNDLNTYKAKALAVNNAEIYFDIIAVSESPENIQNPTLAAAQAADELLFISGVHASFVICGYDGRICISARSLGGINVQVLMERLGGGGHQTVAGAQLSGITAHEVKTKLLNEIDIYLKEVKKS